MTTHLVSLLPLTVCLGLVSCGQEPEITELNTPAEKMSYAMGLNIGGSLKISGPNIDMAALIQGIKDTLTDRRPLLTDQEKERYMREFRAVMINLRQVGNQELADKNQAEGREFLEQNKKKPGVITTSSGLQYEVLQEGDGPRPTKKNNVKIHYRGRLIDGTEFDSSYKHGGVASIQVSDVMAGWTEALQLMKEGSKYRLFIPSELAYGQRGSPPRIGANMTLIFEMEIIEIVR